MLDRTWNISGHVTSSGHELDALDASLAEEDLVDAARRHLPLRPRLAGKNDQRRLRASAVPIDQLEPRHPPELAHVAGHQHGVARDRRRSYQRVERSDPLA